MWRAARSGRCHNGDEDVSFGGGDGESGVFWGAGDDAAGFLVLMAVGELGEVECRGVVAWCRARNSQSVSNALARLRRMGLLEVKGQRPCVTYAASAEGRRVIEGRFARLRLRMQDDEEVKR